jgi:hypothetical protein
MHYTIKIKLEQLKLSKTYPSTWPQWFAGCSKDRRASWPIGSPPHSSSAKALLKSVRVQQSFPSSSRSSAGALSEFCEFQ